MLRETLDKMSIIVQSWRTASDEALGRADLGQNIIECILVSREGHLN